MAHQVFQSDCIEFMSDWKFGEVDFIFADPPYNISNNANSNNTFNGYNSDKGEWDSLEVDDAWVDLCCSILKPNGVIAISGVFGSLIPVWQRLQVCNMKFLSHFVWHKSNPAPSIRRRIFTHANEIILIFSKGAGYTFNYDAMKEMNGGKQMHNVVTVPCKRKINGIVSKPDKLMDIFVSAFTNEGELVFDPFLGTGSTGVSAIKLGRNFIGCDVLPEAISAFNGRL